MNELNILREQIDNIDAQIVSLLCQRLDAVKCVAEYKKAHGLEVLQHAREAEILNRIESMANEREYAEHVLKIYAAVLETSKYMQRKI